MRPTNIKNDKSVNLCIQYFWKTDEPQIYMEGGGGVRFKKFI